MRPVARASASARFRCPASGGARQNPAVPIAGTRPGASHGFCRRGVGDVGGQGPESAAVGAVWAALGRTSGLRQRTSPLNELSRDRCALRGPARVPPTLGGYRRHPCGELAVLGPASPLVCRVYTASDGSATGDCRAVSRRPRPLRLVQSPGPERPVHVVRTGGDECTGRPSPAMPTTAAGVNDRCGGEPPRLTGHQAVPGARGMT
jgi:hypothetical protein